MSISGIFEDELPSDYAKQRIRQQTLVEVKQWLDTLIAETDQTHPLEAAHMQLVAIQFDKKYGEELEE